MTTHQVSSAPPPPGPLARYHRDLPRLAVLLRGAGLPVGPDRWQNIYDLLLALNARGQLPQRVADLEQLIAPLLCRSEQEQRQFGELFARWARDLEPDLRGPEPGTAATTADTDAPPQSPPLPRLGWWLSGLALLFLVLAGTLYWYHIRSQAPSLPPSPDKPISSPLPLDDQLPPETKGLTLEPVPPRTPPEQPTLDPVHRARLEALGDLLLILPGCLALVWLLIRWLTWKTVLERRRGDPNDPLTHIGLAAHQDDPLAAPDLQQTLKRLHTPVAVPTRHLDLEATVDRTARHAGLLQPVRRARRRVPELVVLVEQHHVGDQMAGLAGELVDRLHAAGLDLYRYDYRDSPRRLIGHDGRWRPLAAVAGRHAGARLLLIGEPAALIDPFSDAALPWLDAFASWPERGLLVTRRPPERWQTALAAAGFLVAELDSAGIRALALCLSDRLGERLSNRPAGADPALPGLTLPLPRLLQDARRWTQPVAPAAAEQAGLLSVLIDYLGPDGSRLLTAMAAYPQLHWGLTRLLDLSLFPDPDPVARERRLLKVARLPWSRAGWLPDWLRADLLERLDRGDEHRLRRLYRRLLRPEPGTGTGRLALPVNLPRAVGPWTRLREWLRQRGWRLDRWLSASRTLSAEHGALNDAIFADVLFGWRLRLLDFVLPKRLLRPYLGGTLRRALLARTALAVILAAGGAWLAGSAWHQWLREAAESRPLARQNAVHAEYRVTIRHRKETAELAQALFETLAANGFDTAIIEAALELPGKDAESLPPVNRIQWGDPADESIANSIARRLTYLTWGQVPEVTDQLGSVALAGLAQPPEPKALRVLLWTPGTTGSGFTDPLAEPLTPEQIAELTTPPELPSEALPPEALPPEAPQTQTSDTRETQPTSELPGRTFRDPLRIGGTGPEMVRLPGGSFLMGSPKGEPERVSDESPPHQVTVRAFAIGRTEVRFVDYDRFAEATGREKPDDEGWGRGDQPVINVSWRDAQAYAAWLSEQTGHSYRLPSEAEWEYAARAGTSTPFWTGDCIHTDQANYNGGYDYKGCGAKTDVYRRRTVPVGSLPANGFGLHEMAGNVWEWVEDCWHDSYAGAPADGSAWLQAGGGDCARRVLRGGGWYFNPRWLRSALRLRNAAGGANFVVGIRLARTF
ncbi:formylglycine-generating enzyme family protein [Candidatus Thiosymbion oneisti]|uniref:formylglycine-generating enzyme family protein n=1 Tax=Candidatus Thiosymbion oneisti TaxID=589554 RepID=UPI000A889C71|nr:formylglycine-generating enzyme family protein [Candidatus Thiosymbion oneisti]